MIEIKNISQSYSRRGRKKTLKNINFVVPEKAITAMVGANGAGKSTLLGVMANIVPAQAGEVLLAGEDITKIKPSDVAKKIAFLRQTQQLSVKITINDLVEYGRFPHCGGRLQEIDKQKVEEALGYMNLLDLRDCYLNELSGGQRQRAFIAMVLAQDTPYIFLDEPLNNLDIKYSVEMMKTIRMMVDELGKTVIVVLHDINFAAAYANYVVAMKDGEIVQEGKQEEIISKGVLDTVFDHDFNIVRHDGRSVCLYFDYKL
ncbi:MAG: ATP-binding cassette domain-containing protein [Lachnospiraceae bacterium]|nr:ATP-binding cassette domain-containing protein [Lachnospiraceae bacterium]